MARGKNEKKERKHLENVLMSRKIDARIVSTNEEVLLNNLTSRADSWTSTRNDWINEWIIEWIIEGMIEWMNED